MTTILKFKNHLILIILFLSVLTACTKMDYYYKDYVEHTTYVGKVDSAWLFPGNERVKFAWLNPDDPIVNKIIIYWNHNQDSAVTFLDNHKDTGSYILENLPEGDYTFNLVTSDRSNNHSVPVELSTTVSGEIMQNNIDQINRAIDYLVILKDSIVITWKPTLNENMIGSEFNFYDKNNNPHKIYVPVSNEKTIIYNVDSQKPGTIQSLFIPDTSVVALDTFYSSAKEINYKEEQRHSLLLTGVGTTAGDYIDLYLVRVYSREDEPEPSTVAANIDLVHQRSSKASSLQNLYTVSSSQFGTFSSALKNYVEAFDVRNTGSFIELGNSSTAQDLYDQLDEFDRSNMKSAYEDALDSYTPETRMAKIKTGDIILFYSSDRDMYAAIKATNSEDDGNLEIEFKVSRF